MKIEKLNENKIKITFNLDDLEENHIDLYSFLHNTPETQDLFWNILNRAEKECGFNVDNSVIYVEASTSGAGNFILIVTKTNEKPKQMLEITKKKNIRLKRKENDFASHATIFEFQQFDDICELVNTLDLTTAGASSLYQMNGVYYLKVDQLSDAKILEYASVCSDYSLMEAKLNEYGHLIIANQAFQVIHHFFNKKTRN